MATAYDHMAPFQRLNYWLRQHINELVEEIRRLTAERRMWHEPELQTVITGSRAMVRRMDIDAEIFRLSLEQRDWETILKRLDSCLTCSGSGKIIDVIAQDESVTHECPKCKGTGRGA
jgi:hypothetical protein